MQELTYEKAVELLERAVAERGADYVYQGRRTVKRGQVSTACDYFYGGKPACIVGNVFSYLGLSAEALKPHEGITARKVAEDLGIVASPRTLDLLDTVQDDQDAGVSWGKSLANARKQVGAA